MHVLTIVVRTSTEIIVEVSLRVLVVTANPVRPDTPERTAETRIPERVRSHRVSMHLSYNTPLLLLHWVNVQTQRVVRTVRTNVWTDTHQADLSSVTKENGLPCFAAKMMSVRILNPVRTERRVRTCQTITFAIARQTSMVYTALPHMTIVQVIIRNSADTEHV